MILGIDLGGSAIKLAALEKEKVIFTDYIANSDTPAHEVVAELLDKNGLRPGAVAMTGVGAAVFQAEKLGLGADIRRVLEVSSVAAGTVFLTGAEESLTVSIGTGTAFVLTKDGQSSHIGGSAFGGGALSGLCRKILGGEVRETVGSMCGKGDLARVDLLMSELPSCPPTLDLKMTAANLAKTGPETRDEDWAIGILNLVMQTLGSMAFLAASGRGVKTVVFTGGPTAIPEVKGILDPFTKAYGIDYIVPEHSECATAIGAACLWASGDKV